MWLWVDMGKGAWLKWEELESSEKKLGHAATSLGTGAHTCSRAQNAFLTHRDMNTLGGGPWSP